MLKSNKWIDGMGIHQSINQYISRVGTIYFWSSVTFSYFVLAWSSFCVRDILVGFRVCPRAQGIDWMGMEISERSILFTPRLGDQIDKTPLSRKLKMKSWFFYRCTTWNLSCLISQTLESPITEIESSSNTTDQNIHGRLLDCTFSDIVSLENIPLKM